MHKTAGIFWVMLAILYLVLAVVSLCCGEAYDRKIAKAPTMQVTAQGGVRTRVTLPGGGSCWERNRGIRWTR